MLRMPPGKPRMVIAAVAFVAMLVVFMYNAVSSTEERDHYRSETILAVQGHLHQVHKRHISPQRSLATASDTDQNADIGERAAKTNHGVGPEGILGPGRRMGPAGKLSKERQRSPLESDPRMKHLGKDVPQGNVGVAANMQLPPASMGSNQGVGNMPMDGKEANILIQGPQGGREALSGGKGNSRLENSKLGVDIINMNQRRRERIEAPVGSVPGQGVARSSQKIKDVQLVTRNMHKLVHLDLKGAPPKVTYFEQVFPLFKKLGATGLLIEYEDMFPYSGDLEQLSALNAYRPEEIKTILQLAEHHGLIVIPLIQTFGHMEFVLKHAQFRHLREVDHSPQIIIPLKTESLKLIKTMIDQIIELHPSVSHLHIGADEVYHLGESDEAKKLMETLNLDKSMLFIRHVEFVASYIKTKYQQVQPIMWDDMMRKTDLAILQKSSLSRLVEPMVWVYTPKTWYRVGRQVWTNYAQIFRTVWVASAFKGATGPDQIATDISYHLANHKSWLRTLNSVAGAFSKVQGIALTGWQRFDHFAVMCELLPVGLPSLAVNLQVLANGGFDDQVLYTASQLLQCEGNIEVELPNSKTHTTCTFPGSGVYDAALRLRYVKGVAYGHMMRNPSMNAWMNDYHVRQKFINPDKLHVLFHKYQPLMEGFGRLEERFNEELRRIYGSDTINEFVEVHVTAHKQKLESFFNKANTLTSLRAWPRRPLS